MTVSRRSHVLQPVTLAALLVLLPGGAIAQAPPGASLQAPSQSQTLPQMPVIGEAGSPVFTLSAPRGGNAPPTPQRRCNWHHPTSHFLCRYRLPQQAMPHLRAGEVALMTSARFGREMPITSGLTWRVYADKPDNNGITGCSRKKISVTALHCSLVATSHVAFGSRARSSVRLRDEFVKFSRSLPAVCV